MGYLHISNVYHKDGQKILLFKECYELEKVHGTSCHIEYEDDGKPITNDKVLPGKLTFYSGGIPYNNFKILFNEDELKQKFIEFGQKKVTIYGEGYGGSCLKMAHTYGPNISFIVFDIKIDDHWLDVPTMDHVAKEKFGLEVVPWSRIPATAEALNAARDKFSEVAVRRGMGNDKIREGVVLRPLIELTTNNDERVISKHKGEKFSEVATPRDIKEPGKQQVLFEAKTIADEYVVEERLNHVLDHLIAAEGREMEMKDIPKIITAMVEDVYREAAGEIINSKEVSGAIGKRAVLLFKKKLQEGIG